MATVSAADLAAASWRRSARSNGEGNVCVEVARFAGGTTAVRDSKDPAGGVLLVPGPAWAGLRRALAENPPP